MVKKIDASDWQPCAEVQEAWPDVSGNEVNGLHETEPRRPTPVMWHDPSIIPFGKVQKWFSSRGNTHKSIAQFGKAGEVGGRTLPDVFNKTTEWSAERWTAEVKAAALAAGADEVGIARIEPEWVFEGYEVSQKWVVVMVVAMDFEALDQGPNDVSQNEIKSQYDRGTNVAYELAGWMHNHGYEAVPHGGPIAGPVLMIPAAIKAGIGELGKHGSVINRTYGSSFRLANVLCDIPLIEDGPDIFGADDFCQNCQLCSKICPVDAISQTKQTVRGEEKWYVDFDKCLPFFVEHNGCAMCLPACPWSRPGVGETLLAKMARRAD